IRRCASSPSPRCFVPRLIQRGGVMYVRVCSRLIARYGFIMFVCSGAASVAAQEPHDAQHAGHAQTGDQDIPMTRDGSGTSWLPDETPMYALHAQARG